MTGPQTSTLDRLVKQWLAAIAKAGERKEQRFARDAREGMRFFNGPYDFFFRQTGADKYFGPVNGEVDQDAMVVTVNKVAEMVQIFGPVLYHRNPVRQVTPRTQTVPPPELYGQADDPAAAQAFFADLEAAKIQYTVDKFKGDMFASVLNWNAQQGELKAQCRRAIDEAIIKGLSTLWCLSGGTEVYVRYRDDGRVNVVRVRDLFKRWSDADLWDGDKWTSVVAMSSKPRTGGELKITLRSGEVINCTPEHKWPTSRGVIEADGLFVGDVISRTILPDTDTASAEWLPDDIGWLVGLYLAEGCYDGGGTGIQISTHLDEKATHDRLSLLVEKYGGKITWRGEAGTKKWNACVYSRVIRAILDEFVAGYGAFEKHLSAACWQRSNAFLRSLLEGYLDGDGCDIRQDERATGLRFCDNKQLASSLRTIGARLGLAVKIRRRKERSPSGSHFVYLGTVRFAEPKSRGTKLVLQEIVSIEPADWRCDRFYDISVDSEPHLFALASGTLSHNCTVERHPGTRLQTVQTVWDSVDNLFLDPTAPCIDNCQYVARRVVQPRWQVEQRFGRPPGSIKPTGVGQRLWETEGIPNSAREREDTVVWYEVYSKMGIGGRMPSVAASPEERAYYELFGDNCYLAITGGCDYPLNIPPELLEGPDGVARGVWAAQWPTPTWMDRGLPFVPVYFHEAPNDVWPVSHLSPAMGYLQFLVWFYSKIASKIKVTCRDFIAYLDSAGKEVKQALLEGLDLTLIPLSGQGQRSISEVVQFLQHPPWNNDIWKVAEALAEQFDKATGLTELAYGQSSRQLRSAAEAELKSSQLSVRPDDMANKVEDAMSAAARRELIAARWHLTAQDVAPVLGPAAAKWWTPLVEQAEPADMFLGLDCRVEAGSARKPNKEGIAATMQTAMQNLFQPLYQYAQATGDVEQINALLIEWCKANDIPEPDRFLLRPPPAPPVGPEAGPAKEPPPQGAAA